MSERVSAPERASKWRTAFEISSTVVMIALAAALVWQGRARFFDSPPTGRPTATPVPRDPIAINGRPVLGSSSARVAIVEYSDFECPFCGVVARETIPTLKREYMDTGKVMLVFKHLPLPFHSLAPGAAAAAVCSGQQGKFWQMHDRLFAKPMKLTAQDLRASAGQVGLDLPVYDACRAGTAPSTLVDADRSEATLVQDSVG